MTTKPEKSALMTAIGADYSVIKKAQDSVHAMQVSAAPSIDALVKAYGPGPHKMVTADGTLIANFRKAGDHYQVSAIDPAAID